LMASWPPRRRSSAEPITRTRPGSACPP
jgi:hypothetical protein